MLIQSIPHYAWYMGWFKPSGAAGPGHVHPFASYDSSDPAIINAHLDEMQGSGVDGVICCWNGFASNGINALIHRTAHALLQACEQRSMKFGLALDIGAFSYQDYSLTAQQVLEQSIGYASCNFYGSEAAMLHSDGSAYLLQFNWESQAIDWDAIAAKFPSVRLCHRHVTGLDKPHSGGMFTWIDAGGSYHAAQLAALASWQKANPSADRACFIGLLRQFDNRKRGADGSLVTPQAPVWGNLKVFDPDGGRLAAGYINRTRDAIAAGTKITATMAATWNDFEEGSAWSRVRP